MANWCSNSVAFEGNNTALEQVRLEFIKMQLRENKESGGQLPEFISDKKKGYFFDVSLENGGCNFNYQTRWSPNTEILLLIAEYYKVDFIYYYEEIGNQIYGVTVYSNNELKEICLEEEDFEQYDYHEETDTYTFEEENYESDYEILEILLKRKIENYENH
jgi:hypothetical protein